MRKIIAIAAIVLVALVVAVPLVGASPGQSERRERAIRTRLGAQQVSFDINDGFYTQTFNHFGNPASGSVIGETWGETHWDDTDPVNTQGVARAILLHRALRVSLKVQLWGVTDTSTDLITESGTVNSAGRRTVQVATPEVPNLQGDPHCVFFTVVDMSIRWDDGRLSRVRFEMPVGYLNLGCA
jgi:hypothetical protein